MRSNWKAFWWCEWKGWSRVVFFHFSLSFFMALCIFFFHLYIYFIIIIFFRNGSGYDWWAQTGVYCGPTSPEDEQWRDDQDILVVVYCRSFKIDYYQSERMVSKEEVIFFPPLYIDELWGFSIYALDLCVMVFLLIL